MSMAKKKEKQAKVVNTSGKRKTAIARATVKAGKGRVRVNSEPIEILQPEMARNKAMEPLTIAGAMDRLAGVDINVNTTGGGQMGQVDAIRTAIARGLVHYNDGAEGTRPGVPHRFLLHHHCSGLIHVQWRYELHQPDPFDHRLWC